ncbi:MAG: DUF1015 family protein [Candidatus Dormibacteria bacterium]
MADVRPLRALRYDPSVVDATRVLAPPYDVISGDEQDRLYGLDLRNIVRLEFGKEYATDVAGVDDRYVRAAAHLNAWVQLGVLRYDEEPTFTVTTHTFASPDGSSRTRRGLLGRLRATPWEGSDLRPHERTLRGPKEDRLALMRAAATQTSPVFGMWRDAAGIDPLLDAVTARPAHAEGETRGETGHEQHRWWVVDDPEEIAAIAASLEPARLYVADGHHRYETAAAYAAERRAAAPQAPPDADFEFALVYLCDADDPGVVLLPTHRLLLPGPHRAFSLDDLWMRLDDAWEVEAMPSLGAAHEAAGLRARTHHAFAVAGHDGAAVICRPRDPCAGPRQGLDVVVLQEQVLDAAGAGPDAVRSGALRYTRSLDEVAAAVASGEALLGFCLGPPSVAEVIAVADAGGVMPQKSTYFLPKVPTGQVLSPL